jgi:hypothetical protein
MLLQNKKNEIIYISRKANEIGTNWMSKELLFSPRIAGVFVTGK